MSNGKRNQRRTPPNADAHDRIDLLVAYTATLNPRGVRRLIYGHGYSPNHLNDLPGFLQKFIANEGQPAMEEVLAIHPDRDLLLDSPMPTSTALSAFDGPATTEPVTPVQTVAYLVARAISANKKAVVDLVNRHGSAVLYADPTSVVAAAGGRTLLTDNPVFVRELAALLPAPAELTTAWQQAVDGGILTSSTGAQSLLGEISVRIGPDVVPVSNAKRNLGIALAGVSLALVVALLFLFFHGHLRGGKN